VRSFLFGAIFAFSLTGTSPAQTAKRVRVLPLPAIGYSPELGFYGGVAGFFFFPARDSLVPAATAHAVFNYTQRKQILATVQGQGFLARGKFFFRGYATYRIFPDRYWGIGPTAPAAHRENFDSRRLHVRATVLRRVAPALYVGGRAEGFFLYAVRPGALLAGSRPVGYDGGLATGIGYGFQYDTRKNIPNPTAAAFASVFHTVYHPVFGSDFAFHHIEFDFRKYFTLLTTPAWCEKKIGTFVHTLALQLNGTFAPGQTPFFMMPLIGSENDMRGYYRGRFRDLHMAATQIEYRMPLIWRLGLAFFAGVGDVSPNALSFRFPSLKYSYGAGVRFMADRKERVNFRFDFAVGKNENAFYVSFGEAF
jgi:hypothetical protein